jgi:hypothetical protein
VFEPRTATVTATEAASAKKSAFETCGRCYKAYSRVFYHVVKASFF